MLVFAIETSCDETSVCIMEDNKTIHSHIIYSQKVHEKYGGIIPELASRAHLSILQGIVKDAFLESDIKINDIDFFAATCGPGLIGPLLVGSTFAKSLAIGCKKPFIPINHIESHVVSPSYNNKISFPHISLLLSGGHTQIYLLESNKKISLLGESVDDAVGETFDKVGKILNLNYPGGPEVENFAKNGNKLLFQLPTPQLKDKSLNMSFSGIKTAVNLIVKKNQKNNEFISDICASFQFCITKILTKKLLDVIFKMEDKSINISSISVVGGVSNNKYIRNELELFTEKNNIDIFFPIKEMMSDNAAMIAWNCILKDKDIENIYFKPDPRLIIL